ncbi:hypothetical protein Slin15195_G036730 [Septoria linicola]|uniref:Uncharacterized protein n=1 Tax=Septoria linicola TaxID=215465 RepID=A0A9Q9EHT5_9PEZI|nr:hypothetical protein Slin15195_G036730 [Septoria linicola]
MAGLLERGGNPLEAAGGLTGALPGGNPLEAAGGLTDTLGGGGLGDTLGGVSGLAGGLLGGGEGLNLVGLVGVGSDDPALVDLNPAEKKEAKAKKAAIAKKNEQKRQAEMKKLEEQVKAQGGKATPEQAAYAQKLNDSQAAENKELQKLDRDLGPTDPELLAQEMAASDNSMATMSSRRAGNAISEGLFYAYLVDSRTSQPTHVLTFANAAAAEQWYQSASRTSSVEKMSPQMYIYDGGVPPKPVGRRMACMPIQTVQPIIPLQHSNGYPICCKDGGSGVGTATTSSNTSAAQAASNAQAAQAARPAPPPRKKWTWEDAAGERADNAKKNGDPRPREQIKQEALNDLQEQCAQSTQSGSCKPAGQFTSNGLPSGPLNSSSFGPSNASASNTASNGLPPGPLNAAESAADGGAGGDPLAGLLGSGQGLNVANLVAIGSDEKALLDLNPATKKEAKMKRAQELKKQQQIQAAQKKALEDAVAKQNGKATPEQQKAYAEVQKREAATSQASKNLDDSMKKDDEEEAAKGLGAGLPGGDVLGSATGAVPAGLTDGVPAASSLTGAVPGGLPTDTVAGAVGGLPVAGGVTKGLL